MKKTETAGGHLARLLAGAVGVHWHEIPSAELDAIVEELAKVFRSLTELGCLTGSDVPEAWRLRTLCKWTRQLAAWASAPSPELVAALEEVEVVEATERLLAD
jgi:hypothetical protein